MISEKIQQMLNDQLQKEFYSSYLYLSMDAYFKSLDLDGFANFFDVQAKEEKDHAMKIYNYINDVGGKISLKQIDAPKVDFESIEEVLKLSLEHEQFITRSIHELADAALAEKDQATYSFLQWYITEQIEEEANAERNIKRFKLVGNDGRGILMLDAELAQRVYTPLVAENGQG
ncbi:MAG: putative ferritin-1 [Firmicutes bacterium ADurb.Bin419]|nr:MAG: putative ferritin-1 [Firmicutes bacterium ADurb.Bin419]